ncbi:unnamed protein product [Victoria cruziana]
MCSRHYANTTEVPMQVRRGSVLEMAAAAQGVNDRTCYNLGITRQIFCSIGIGGKKHSQSFACKKKRWKVVTQFFLEEGWFARVTDPAIMYSYLFIELATEAYDDLHACPISRI